MSDFGAKISQKGYDVETCPDDKVAFSSSFQTLKIHSQHSVQGIVPSSGVTTITITHNLGFYAPFLVYEMSFDKFTGGYARKIAGLDGARQYINRLEIDIPDTYPAPPGTTAQYNAYIFLDDFRVVNEENIDTGSPTQNFGDDYGIKVSKEGYDVLTATDDQLVFSSSFFTEIIHKKGSFSPTSNIQDSITHNLGYVPSAMVYAKRDTESFMQMCNGFAQNSNPFNGGRVGIEYATNSTELLFRSTESDIPNFSFNYVTSDYDFYYLIFKGRI